MMKQRTIRKNYEMKRKARRILAVILTFLQLTVVFMKAEEKNGISYAAGVPQVEAPSAILMEASTGSVLYEKNADERRSPASITKLMTIYLILEAIENGDIALDDVVSVSAYAKSMGGSQVFLEEGETQTVETLLKCIIIASGNDASVAMAEYLAGSESAFVDKMNGKAVELNLTNTHFTDCCGLTDSDEHYTSAHDVAVLGALLLMRYPKVKEYSTIWMEDMVHVTRKGSSVFTLSSTNKLLKQYEWATGLKTGSTSKAKYCFCGTAQKDGIELVAVVMASPTGAQRFRDAKALLEYGYSLCRLYRDEDSGEEKEYTVKVKGGVCKEVAVGYEKEFCYLDTEGRELLNVRKEECIPIAKAPVVAGEPAGYVTYYCGDKELGRARLVYRDTVRRLNFLDAIKRVWTQYLL